MDELTLLRELDQDIAPPAEAVLDRAFADLTREMRASTAHRYRHVPTRGRPRRLLRRVLLTGGGVAATVALTAGLFFSDVIGLAGLRPGAAADAAEVLHQAARNTIHTSDPVLRPGQYLRIQMKELREGSLGKALWIESAEHRFFIPADRSGTWVHLMYVGKPVQFLTPGSKAVALAQYRQHIQERGFAGPAAYVGKGGPDGRPYKPDGVDIASLPTDPRVLLNRLYREGIGAGQNPDQEAFAMVGDLLRSGVVPAKTRAALFEAAALIPGVTRTSGTANLDGRKGIAIGRTESSTQERTDLVIDPATGLFIGERDYSTVAQHVAGVTIPAGTAEDFTSIRTSVVDALPRGALDHVEPQD